MDRMKLSYRLLLGDACSLCQQVAARLLMRTPVMVSLTRDTRRKPLPSFNCAWPDRKVGSCSSSVSSCSGTRPEHWIPAQCLAYVSDPSWCSTQA